MSARRRLDTEMVRRHLVDSRSQAAHLIGEGRVFVQGAPAERASRLVSPAEAIVISGGPPKYVGRGGEKLVAALDRWPHLLEALQGANTVDCGASTGGFTDCLLQHGAQRVCAVDVGHGQFHERLRGDPRVDVRERTDVRELDVAGAGGPFDVLVADLSFISLRTVAPALVQMCQPSCPMVLLVKPQFEVGRAVASRTKGVITDDSLRTEALDGVVEVFTELGCRFESFIECPVHGAEGNREFLALFTSPDVQL